MWGVGVGVGCVCGVWVGRDSWVRGTLELVFAQPHFQVQELLALEFH